MDLTKFDNIRPYNDSEVHPALERIVANPLLGNIANYIFPGADPENPLLNGSSRAIA